MKRFLIRLQSLIMFQRGRSLTIFVMGLFYLALSQPQSLFAAPVCSELFVIVPPGRVGNIYGSVSSEDALEYGQIGFRDFDEISLTFSGEKLESAVPQIPRISTAQSEFVLAVESLHPGDVVYDSGGFSGLVGFGMAAKFGVHVTTLSLHDFFPAIVNLSKNLSTTLIELDVTQEQILKVGSLDILSFQKMAKAVGMDFSSSKYGHGLVQQKQRIKHISREAKEDLLKKQIAVHARNVLNRFIVRTKVMQSLGKFQYVIGPAEDFFLQVQKKAKLIIDMFGAYFYSPNRMQLIQDYYNHLEPGGKAFVFLHPDTTPYGWINTGIGPAGFIQHPLSKRYFETTKYLIFRYPNIFSIQKHLGRVSLVIRRVPEVEVLDLGLTPDSSQMKVIDNSKDYVYPTNIIYHPDQDDPFFK